MWAGGRRSGHCQPVLPVSVGNQVRIVGPEVPVLTLAVLGRCLLTLAVTLCCVLLLSAVLHEDR